MFKSYVIAMNRISAVDLFAGAGGTSTGLAQACQKLGKTPSLTAINHWEKAIETHAENHPWATHINADLGRLNPMEVIPSKKVDILVASPECTFFSRARGGKPILDQKRTPAFHVIKWLETLDVDSFLVENVPEFEHWGPLNKKLRPIKKRKGETFKAWIRKIKSLGYNVDYRVLNSADYGDATSRRRLFIIGKKGQPLTWPEPVRSKTGGEGKKKWRGAKEVIDWSITGESIFTRKKPLCRNTINRIIEGLNKFCTDDIRPFLVLMEHSGVNAAGHGTKSVEEPFPTITNARGGAMGLVNFVLPNEGIYRGNTAKSVDEPIMTVTQRGAGSLVEAEVKPAEPFIIPKESGPARSVKRPFGAITTRGGGALVEPFIIPNFGRRKNQKPRIHRIDKPLPSPTSRGAGNLVQAFILSQDGRAVPRSVNEPMNTILTAGAHQLVDYLITYYKHGNSTSVEEPMPTPTTHDRIGLVQPMIDGKVLDIRFRMLTPKELAGAMGFPDDYVFKGTRTEIVKQIGNAVAVNMAQALCMALLGKPSRQSKILVN